MRGALTSDVKKSADIRVFLAEAWEPEYAEREVERAKGHQMSGAEWLRRARYMLIRP